MKKLLSVILALVMILTVIPMIVFAAEPTSGTCGDNLTWFFNDETDELIIEGTGEMYDGYLCFDERGPKSVVIGNGVTSIGDRAFMMCTKLESITIPDTVTSIGNSAFSECYRLANTTIPNSVTSIGNGAFAMCPSLVSITIPNSVTSIGDNAFSDCSNLINIIIPDSVTSIGNGAFELCTKLTSITIPNSVTSIGEGVFSWCSGLTNITIPDSVTSIGDGAFSDCNSLTNVIIPDSVTKINYGAFGSCDNLASVTIGDSVNWIGESAFSSCGNLKNVTMGNNVTTIAGYAFAYCDSLTSIEVPDSVTSIGSCAFAYCDNLEEVKISEFARLVVADDALLNSPRAMLCCEENSWFHSYADSQGLKVCLYDKDGIPSFEIKNDVLVSYRGESDDVFVSSAVKIGYGAFENNEEIKRVELSTAINRIYDSAFKNCSSLETIIIPQNVAFIGDDSFEGCNNLTIYGYAGSYAETYAKKHGIDFEYITLTVSAETYEMNIFDTLQLETDYNIFLNEEDEIVWSCDDNGVVSVSSKGKVTALSSGEAVVTATSSKGLSATCIIKVGESATEEKGKVHSVTISGVALDYKASTTITPSIIVDLGVKYTVTYSSSNPSVASVDANGKVTTNGTGSATITVTVTDEFGNTVSDTCEVKVNYNWWQWIIVIVLFGWIWY